MTALDSIPTTATETSLDASVETVAEALTERLFEATLGTLELATVWLGVKLGLYDALVIPSTEAEVAAATDLLPRYVREWLEQQAIAGLVCVDAEKDPAARRYHLSDAQRLVFLDQESPFYAGAMALLGGGCGAAMPTVLEAWKAGRGVPFGEYGDDVRGGQALFNRGAFLGPLVSDWLPAVPDVDALLRRDGARALDLGCGVGWSGIALTQAYPGLTVDGVDSDDASIMDARTNAAEAGVGDRARFEVRLSDGTTPEDAYDVAFFFESLHDMGHPVEALTAVRRGLRPGGRVFVMDEGAEDEFAPDGSPVERLLGASSVLHCLPVGMSEPDSAGTGALFRPSTMRAYAEAAGFSTVRTEPIDHPMFRFYVLEP